MDSLVSMFLKDLGDGTYQIPGNASTTYGSTSWGTSRIITEDTPEKLIKRVSVAGVNPEDIKVSIKNNILNIFVPESDFVFELNYSTKINFPITKKDIMFYIENGVLVVEINKPEDYEFQVERSK